MNYQQKIINRAGFTLPDAPPEADYASLPTQGARDELYEASNAATKIYYDKLNAIDGYCLAPYKSELFLKLRNGDIASYGYLSEKLKKDAKPVDWQKEESWEEIDAQSTGYYGSIDPHTKKYVGGGLFIEDVKALVSGKSIKGFYKIPAEFWNQDSIEWDSDYARSHLGSYNWIFVSAEALFAHFPQPAGKSIGIEERAGYLVYDDNSDSAEMINKPASRRGRPADDWPEFHAEIHRYIAESGALPKKANRPGTPHGNVVSATLEIYSQSWCYTGSNRPALCADEKSQKNTGVNF